MNLRETTEADQSEEEIINESLKSNFRQLFHEWIFFQMKMVREEGLSIPQLFMLRYLYYNKPRDLSSIASFMGVSKPSISGIMNTLERDGFVKRTRDGRRKDRRRTDVSLTKKSLDLFRRFEDLTTFIIDDFLDSIPKVAMVNLNSTMIALAERLKNIDSIRKGE